MNIKYVDLPWRKQTVAIARDIEFDVFLYIKKIIGNNLYDRVCGYNKKYLMPKSMHVTVTAIAPDEYNKEEGRRQARMKLMDHYYKSLHKRVDWFVSDMKTAIERINEYEERYK